MAANTVELHHVARDMCAYNHIVNATLHKLLLCQHKIFSRITENNIVFFLCRCVIAFQPETVILQFLTPDGLLTTQHPSASRPESSDNASSERAILRIISAPEGCSIKLFSFTTRISSTPVSCIFSSAHTAKSIALSFSTELGENLSSRKTANTGIFTGLS